MEQNSEAIAAAIAGNPAFYVREILGEDVELFSSVNARRKKDIEDPARGIAKITKHGNVQCIAGHNMVFLSKDYSTDAYIFGCPVLNEEARKKLEHMGMEVPLEDECDKKAECSPNSEIGRIYRAKREMLSQIDCDNPQFSYHCSGECRICRGGSWNYGDYTLRSAYRSYFPDPAGGINIGFRCVQDVPK